jgi:Fe-Mn family superoxide dismutase
MAKFELPPLPYDYSALEPHIDEQTMRLHHDKHHLAYTNGLNAALEKHPELGEWPVEKLLTYVHAVPEGIRGAVNFHGGGYHNHAIFWQNMSPQGGGEPSGALADAINASFGSFARFKEQFSAAAGGVQGSGWAWLVYNPLLKDLQIKAMPNQTSPLTEGLLPLLGIDVWEHAYYLKYQNRRPDYISAWWNVVNWEDAARRYDEARASD